MAKSNTSATRVAYILEAVAGTTPVTPAWQRLRVTGEDFDVSRESKVSEELDPSRNVGDSVLSQSKAAGGAKFEFSDGSFEDIMALAVGGNWAADVLVNGVDENSMSVEVAYEGGAVDIFKRLTGCYVNDFNLDFKPGSILTGGFNVLGMGSVYDVAEVAGATYIVPNTEDVMVSSLDFGSLSVTGMPTIECVTSLSMKWANNLRPRYCLNGSLDPESIGWGQFECTGELELYLDQASKPILDALVNNTATGIAFTVGRTTLKKAMIEMPRVKITNAKVTAEGQNNDVMIKANFQAIKSPILLGNTIRITRNVV